MSLKTWLLFMYGFVIYLSSSAQFCARSYVNGKWISKGNCGVPEKMSGMQKELQRKIKDEKKKSIAGKGWTVFQRRINGDVDFYRGWDDYKKGFGNSKGDLWLGLEKLYNSTKEGDMELEINMIINHSDIHYVAKYRDFRIGPGSENYTLHVSGFSGNTQDVLSRNNNEQFSTRDADHDGWDSGNCAYEYEGGWWYRINCGGSNLNGNFNKTYPKGIFWWDHDRRRRYRLLRFSEMKFRKRT